MPTEFWLIGALVFAALVWFISVEPHDFDETGYCKLCGVRKSKPK
jgi:hypothetical protein